MKYQDRLGFANLRAQLLTMSANLSKSAQKTAQKMAVAGFEESKAKTPADTGQVIERWKLHDAHKVKNTWVAEYYNECPQAFSINHGHPMMDPTGKTVGYTSGIHMLEQGVDLARNKTEAFFIEEMERTAHKTRG